MVVLVSACRVLRHSIQAPKRPKAHIGNIRGASRYLDSYVDIHILPSMQARRSRVKEDSHAYLALRDELMGRMSSSSRLPPACVVWAHIQVSAMRLYEAAEACCSPYTPIQLTADFFPSPFHCPAKRRRQKSASFWRPRPSRVVRRIKAADLCSAKALRLSFSFPAHHTYSI